MVLSGVTNSYKQPFHLKAINKDNIKRLEKLNENTIEPPKLNKSQLTS